RLGSLSGGQRQSVAVARAVSWASRVVFMDEPTAALGVVQTRRVLDLIRRVRDRGVSVVLISHNMPEVLAVSDRVEVLRLGRRVAQIETAGATVERLVGAMTGALDADGAAENGPGDPTGGPVGGDRESGVDSRGTGAAGGATGGEAGSGGPESDVDSGGPS
ncbi:MAG: simple sugar transport system ATP-binding protein, partial [Mycobacteriales bacterium]